MRSKILAFVLATLTTPSVLASGFRDHSWVDEMSDTSSTVQKVTSIPEDYLGLYPLEEFLGFRCDSSTTGKDFFLTFGSYESIATPSSPNVTLKYRVDSGKVYEVKAQMFSNSYKSGSVREFPQELISEIKAGSKLLVNIYSYKTTLEDRQTFNLAGSDAAVSTVQKACGITSEVAKSISIDEKAIKKVMGLYLKGEVSLDKAMKVATKHYDAINK